MVDENDQRPGWGSRIVKGFYKSWAWLCAVFAVIIAYGPDVASVVLEQMGVIAVAFPSLSAQTKAVLLLVGHMGVIFLRPIRQPRAMRPDDGNAQPVMTIQVPDTIVVERGGEPIEAQVVRHERVKLDPGPPT